MYPFLFPKGILFVAGSWCGHKSNACGLCCSTWGLQAFFMVLCRVLTQNAGPIDTSVDGRTAEHLPPGLPSLSKSTQNCCAHKNEVMKTNSPVCQFLKKKITRGKWQNKSAFYFLWYSEIRVEIYYKPLKIKEASFWVWLEPSLNCFSNFTSLSEIVHSQTMPRFIYHFKIKLNFQPVILSTLFYYII